MRSMLETHGFLTWSVIASICCLHVINFSTEGRPEHFSIKKSFSEACGNLASGLLSSAIFVTRKWRRLPLSHMVPSVSGVLTWILISDRLILPRGISLHPHQSPRLPVQFRLMIGSDPLRFSYFRTRGRVP